MNGPMSSCNAKRNVIEEFVARVNPYEKPAPLKFDLRGYAKYVKDHDIPAGKITPEIMEMFQQKE